MAVDIGSTASMLATPWIKDHWGWHAALAVCCAGMLLAVLYTRLAKRGNDVSVAAKDAVGFVVAAAGFFVYAASGRYAVDGRVSSWFMVGGYGL
jgi:dipeptide/tripeptide permease